MIVLAHRGWWTDPSEKNSLGAMARAFDSGFGVETDIRDLDGELVVAHDMPRRGSGVVPFSALLDLYKRYPAQPWLALNVKADGLSRLLGQVLADNGISNYFVFDMSVPDTLGYLDLGMRVLTRRSEFETGSVMDARAQGLWLDAFEEPYVPAGVLKRAMAEGGLSVLVSPELHRKPHLEAWARWRTVWREAAAPLRSGSMICTDYPGEAREFFRLDT